MTLLGSVWLAPGAVVLSQGILCPLPQEIAEVETAGEGGCYGISREEVQGAAGITCQAAPVSSSAPQPPAPSPGHLACRGPASFPRVQLHPGPGRQARCRRLSPQRQCQAPGPHGDSPPLCWAARRGGRRLCCERPVGPPWKPFLQGEAFVAAGNRSQRSVKGSVWNQRIRRPRGDEREINAENAEQDIRASVGAVRRGGRGWDRAPRPRCPGMCFCVWGRRGAGPPWLGAEFEH